MEGRDPAENDAAGSTTELAVLRVFTDAEGMHGNRLGVVLEGTAIPRAVRQRVAADLNFSETVFVDDVAGGRLAIFAPAVELPFAGHPLVGTSWLLAESGHPVTTLRPPAGEIPTWREPDGTQWVRGRPEWAPEMAFVELPSPAAVEALAGPPEGGGFVYCYASGGEGRVRARVFAPAIGVDEDEATGAGAVRLAERLGRELVITQGRGSLLHARPAAGGAVDVGGRVVFDELRRLAVPRAP